MRKIFITFGVLLTISVFAQQFVAYNDQVFGVSEYGDILYFDDNYSASKTDSGSNFGDDNVFVDCSCYQGYNEYYNAYSDLVGSCCWMQPTKGKPRCGKCAGQPKPR